MKTLQILLLFSFLSFLSCAQVDDDDSAGQENCERLQDEYNEATFEMQNALGLYSMDTGNGALCADYAATLNLRIERAQAMIDANPACLNAFQIETTKQTIEEDQAEIDRLNC